MAKKKSTRKRKRTVGSAQDLIKLLDSGAQPPESGPPIQLPIPFPETVQLVHSPPEEMQRRADIMDIVLAKGEEKMTQALEAAQAANRRLNEEAAKLDQEAGKLLEKEAKEVANEVLEVIRNSELAEMLQFPRRISCAGTADRPTYNAERKRWSKTFITVRVFAKATPSDREDLILRTLQRSSDPEIIRKLSEVRKLREQAAAAYNEAMSWKKRLAQMGRLERVTRASLAEQRVRTTEEGAQALDQLLDSLDSHIESLPGV